MNFILLFAALAGLANCDCGCNKLKRDATPLPAAPVKDLYENVSPQDSCHITADGTRVCSSSPYADDDDEDSTFKRALHESRDDHMSFIPGGQRSRIGTDQAVFADDKESPVREVNVEPFYLDRYEVSNADFGRFVEATGYQTDADVFGDSFVFRDEISEAVQAEYVDFRVASATWWYKVKNVTWQHPEGIGSGIEGEWQWLWVVFQVSGFSI